MAETDSRAAETGDAEDFLKDVREKFERASERENDNRVRGLADLKFARMGQQWEEKLKADRETDGRPCLTINKLPTFIRQVVNDARQNKPAISVHPVDSGADVETAEILSGLIRNIEVSSDADVAYDTAVECAASNSFGYFRINTAYTSDDSFDQDIVIERIANPFTVYGDPYSEAADSSDWNCAFVVTTMSKEEFARKYRDADQVDWNADGYTGLAAPWRDGDTIMVAEYWHRETVEKEIVELSNRTVVDHAKFKAEPENFAGLTVLGEPRVVRSKKVTQYILTGAEIIDTVDWPGSYIPIVPVYGDEVNVEGKRELYSLTHFGQDSQREYNYHRSAAVELVALAPKAPYIGEEGAFDADVEKWSTANDVSHPYIEYSKGSAMPQRQPFTGVPAGEMQLALQATDDIKSTIGMYDASLGARSNETSGVAIRQRQREGDVATFHFIDNLSRAIRHGGRILIDLIPKVYSSTRVLRVLGQDMQPQTIQVSPQAQQMMAQAQAEADQQAMMLAQRFAAEQQYAAYQAELQARIEKISRIYDITAGKYDLTVKVGPAFATQREEARGEIVEIIRAVPASAPVLGPMYLRNSDWPGADEAADKIEAMQEGQGGGAQAAPDAALQQQMAAMQQQLQQTQAENEQLKQANGLKETENAIKGMEAKTKAYEAETDRIRALSEANTPAPITY